MESPRDQRNRQNRIENRPPPTQLTAIRFVKPLDPELFNSTALKAARDVARNSKFNKPSQLRRFYDELLTWEIRVAQRPDKFDEYLPMIRMINAKVAYAKGRNLVDTAFVEFVRQTLSEVKTAESLTICKLFWEAFMGFYKSERPSE